MILGDLRNSFGYRGKVDIYACNIGCIDEEVFALLNRSSAP
jgi:hypothetical protein